MFSMPGFSGEVHKVSPDDAAKHLQENVEPSYPSEPNMRVRGNVILQIEISESGDVTSIKAVSGHPILLTAAIDAVRKWHYAPFLVEGKPVAVQTTVVVPFSPGDSSERIKQVAELIDLYNQTFELCRKQRIEGPYTEAERTCKRSISLAEQFEPARRLERMSTFRETGHVLFLEGKYAEALESYQKELSIGESFLTDVNAELAAAQHDVGNALWGDRPS